MSSVPVVCEVGPRDGLQNEPGTLPPAQRAELCRRLSATGLRSIEAVSFVRDDRVPQMAGAERVLADLGELDRRARISGLVLNRRGAERALAAGLTELHLAVMATDGFARRNTGMGVGEALRQAHALIGLAHAAGVRVLATVSVAFGCPIEGPVPEATALGVAEALARSGADGLVLADTIGVATPRAVRRRVRAATGLGVPVGIHLHDTRNTALAGSLAALEAGATHLEASIGGLGGCPFAPGAAGNLATEELIDALEGEGVDTGVALEGLIEVTRWLEQVRGRPVPSALAAAGPRVVSGPAAVAGSDIH